MSETVEQEHKKFKEWHKKVAGFPAISRSTIPGHTNDYENPFTQGAWTLWQSIYIDLYSANSMKDRTLNNTLKEQN